MNAPAGPHLVGSVLFGADDVVRTFVQTRIAGMEGRSFGAAPALGIIRDGHLVGGVVYRPLDETAALINVAMAGGIAPLRALFARDTMRMLFAYPFEVLGMVRLTALIAGKNKRARRVIKHVGFVEEGKHPLGWFGRDTAFSYGLVRRDCRWLKD